MKLVKTFLCSAALAMATTGFALAQEEQHGFQLPEQCVSGMEMEAGAGPAGSEDQQAAEGSMGMGMEGMDMESMTDAQRANMQSMMETMPAMHEGMMNEDPDVAFACGMIAHHQGASDMAEVQLEYGDDEAMRQLAQTIIEDQKREIEAMTQWLAENAS